MIVEEQTFEVELETLCIFSVDLGVKAERGLKRTMLYRVVDGGPTATSRTRLKRVRIEQEKDSACRTQAAFAGAGGWQGGRQADA